MYTFSLQNELTNEFEMQTEARGGKNQSTFTLCVYFIDFSFSHQSHFPSLFDMVMPLEACSTEYFGADTITQFHHFYWISRDASERRGLERLHRVSFPFAQPKFLS